MFRFQHLKSSSRSRYIAFSFLTNRINLSLFTVLRNGHIKQQNLNISENEEIKKSSLTVSDQTDEEEEGDHVTPLPGSTVNLDIVSWPSEDTDPSGQVRVTVIPSAQVCVLSAFL